MLTNMKIRPLLGRMTAAALASLLALPAAPGMLYKSVAENGTVVFSDVPLAEAQVVEQLRMPESAPHSGLNAVGLPVYEFPEYDTAIARANERVDLAEHALAIARQGLWSPRDGLQLAAARMTSADADRVAFFKRDLKIARQQLVDLLRERQAAAASRYLLAAR
jgi:hypothetical protein